ncbi:uncharacterized protein RHOBADRAFT_46984 [Rhodotorula graminis WP1]|uniref:Copper-fist domain-containing protein n=1 Tax=Rhodotorula graminis (strain WP1) TaxID=578459 RepID=A0A0P9GGX3_RHOGW|nr:uncharacterized protein RHOBADRAFT_46984 [Rhodotorula graminis WP1]KPV72142.1 hypothetical protein RHOBADRAFT_46984 [Rhodotorula graminis WP1]
MVLIDGTKYACQQCIKGHRSSKCTHTARPLTEIKKKGRPTSQCTHCRQLRKTKSVHGRCDCAARDAEQKASPRLLPNGLVDAVSTPEPEGGSSSFTTTEPSGVTRLLNPCNCLRGGKCTCCSVVKRSAPKPFPGDEAAPVASTSSSAGGGCCSSSRTITNDDDDGGGDYFHDPVPPAIDFSRDIPVSTPSPGSSSHLAFPPTTAPLPPPPPSTTATTPSDALFLLPATHGTHACFCGPTCAGGGMTAPPMSGIELPSLWAHGAALPSSTSSSSADPFLTSTSTSTPNSTSPGTTTPLPSLRTLYPALLDLELGDPTTTTFAAGTAPAPPAPASESFEDAAAALALALGLGDQGGPRPQFRADCSAVYLAEPLDDACGGAAGAGGGTSGAEEDDDEGCHCSSACGCRGGANGGGGAVAQKQMQEQEQEKEEREAEMRRVAQLAALGAFG